MFVKLSNPLLTVLFAVLVIFPMPVSGAENHLANDEIQTLQSSGIAFLKSSQNDDGSWTSPKILGITALALAGMLESGADVSDASVQKGLDFLLARTQPDGGIYDPGSNHKNYETSIALRALVAANQDHQYDDNIKKAVEYLKSIQWDQAEGADPSSPAYGGQGYGGHKRPDLSNTAFFLDALVKAGLTEDDPAMQQALVFVSRCQNLESEHNTTPFASKVNDGGFYYTPASGGSSQAGETENGGLRSYASMTYAGLKSMIYAGLSMEDPRVQAAYVWLQKHYTLKENPGMGQQGLYYYYHTLSKTLTVLGKDSFTDESGQTHDWNTDLVTLLKDRQLSNGSWVNPTDRWYEGDPNLVTAYVLMTLANCQDSNTP